MIHARRIKPKRNSTKEMLEGTVVSNSRAQKVRVDEVMLEEGSTLKSSTGQTRATQSTNSRSTNSRSTSSKSEKSVKRLGAKRAKKTDAFNEAFSKAKPFSGVTRLRNSRNNRASVAKGIESQNPRQKFLKRLVYLAIFCVLAFVLVSLSFRTETVIVQGNQHLNALEVQSLSKIRAGTPLLWVSERNVKDLLRNPWVDNVKINRDFPHTVLIELRERTPVALLSINIGEELGAGTVQNQTTLAAYSADGYMLPNVSADVLDGLTPIDGWGKDRSLEGLELLNYFNNMSELSVTKIDYTPEGFEASFEYGIYESSSEETSFILGQLQTPSLTLLKEHWSAFVYALATNETGELKNMAGSLEDKFIVPAPLVSGGQDDQETRRIVKRKWITIYGWGVSLSE